MKTKNQPSNLQICKAETFLVVQTRVYQLKSRDLS
jgi:hypothetical protein